MIRREEDLLDLMYSEIEHDQHWDSLFRRFFHSLDQFSPEIVRVMRSLIHRRCPMKQRDLPDPKNNSRSAKYEV